MSDDVLVEGDGGGESSAGSAGKLYVMRERDYLTQVEFDYYKIGIVRGDKDVLDREKQHRTGNPREVITLCEVSSKDVQRLETRLHNHFAPRRVSSGEWFHFPESDVTILHNRVDQVSREVDALAGIVVPQGSDIQWSAAPVPDDGTGAKSAKNLLLRQAALEVVVDNLKIVSQALLEVARDEPELSMMLKTSNIKASRSFSTAELKRIRKDLYEQFKTKVRTSISFSVTFDDVWVNEEIQRIRESRSLAAESLEALDPYSMHAEYLRLWAERDQLKFDVEFAEQSLKALVGSCIGIEDVAMWVQKESVAFDRDRFKSDHPDIFEQCHVVKEAQTSVNIAEWVSYRR